MIFCIFKHPKSIIMKKLLLTVFLFSTISYGQSLERKGPVYYYDGQMILKSSLKKIYRSYPEALQYYKKGNLKYGLSCALMLYGGIKLTLRISNSLDQDELNLQNGAIDLGFLIVGLLISAGKNDYFDRAVSIYNKRTKKKTSFLIRPSKEKLGLSIRF